MPKDTSMYTSNRCRMCKSMLPKVMRYRNAYCDTYCRALDKYLDKHKRNWGGKCDICLQQAYQVYRISDTWSCFECAVEIFGREWRAKERIERVKSQYQQGSLFDAMGITVDK